MSHRAPVDPTPNTPLTVSDMIDMASQAVDITLEHADDYLTRLTEAADVAFTDGFNIDNILPDAYDYATVPDVFVGIAAGGIRPDVTDISIAAPPEITALSFTTLADIALPVDDLLAPTNEFTFYEAAYSSTLLDPLKAKLLADLTNGGYGIDTADEVALFNRARDREVDAAMTRVEEAGRAMATRGFPLPPGELSIHIDRAYQDMQNKVSSVSRDITLERSKLFVENRQFTIREVKELEQITIGFHNSVQERALNVAKATAEVAILVYNALIARYRARLEASKVTSDVQFQIAQAEAARAQSTVEGFRAQVAAYEARLRGLIEPMRLRVELYGMDIAANKNLTDGLIARVALQTKVIEATTQQNIQISNMTIEMAKAKLQATVQALLFKTEAVKFGSEKFFALLTAMQASINTLAVQSSTE